jgi:hypothetical protein
MTSRIALRLASGRSLREGRADMDKPPVLTTQRPLLYL